VSFHQYKQKKVEFVHIFVIKKITTGLSEEPFVYKSGRPYKLSTFSNIKNIFIANKILKGLVL